ncbi:hypothetical protein KEM56_006653 [Ascosphaera pollenicola]|nr:hypothetical protein KEM56_006653 [Ascosphaera pollenicola]
MRAGEVSIWGIRIGEQYIPPAPRRDDGDRYGSGNSNRRSMSRGGDRGSRGRFGGDRGSGGRFGGDRGSGGRFGGGDRGSGGRFGGERFGSERGQGFAQRNPGSPFDKFKDRSSLNEFQERNPVHKPRRTSSGGERKAPWMGRGAQARYQHLVELDNPLPGLIMPLDYVKYIPDLLSSSERFLDV